MNINLDFLSNLNNLPQWVWTVVAIAFIVYMIAKRKKH